MKSNIRLRSMFALLSLMLGVVLGACGADTSVTEVDARQAPKPQEPTSDKEQADLRASVSKAMQRDAPIAYAAVDEGSGRVRLDNPAQRMTSSADRTGIVVSANEDSSSLQLRTSSYGCEGLAQRVVEQVPTTINNRVSYRRDELRMEEWYLNGPLGLEQGFTLSEAANCTGTKVIEMRVDGLSPSLDDSDGDGRGSMVRFGEDDGRAQFVYRDLTVVDASGKTLSSWITMDAGAIAIHFDDAGAVYPVVVDPLVTQQQTKLSATDGAAIDFFGVSVSISGDTAIVGAYRDDDKGSDSGSAYVFVRNGTTWTQQAKLTASDGSSYDEFGISVAISGDTAIVGAHVDDDHGANSGSVYVFVKPASGWATTSTYNAKLTASDGSAYDYFGRAVSISGDTAIVGAYQDDDIINGTDSGSAYVFVKPAGGWSTTSNYNAKLTASDGAATDFFGRGVSISGDTAIVGAYQDDDKGSNSGSAYVFVKPPSGWVTTSTYNAKLTASDGATGDYFGFSVSLSGDTAIVAAHLDDDKGTNSGSAYVFVKPAGGWSTTSTYNAKLNASDGAASDQFGYSVSISGDTAIVGAYLDDDKGSDSGSAYVFLRNGTAWTQQAKLTASDGATGDQFGVSVAISGDTAIVGAEFDDIGAKGDQGSAYVFLIGGLPCTSASQCRSAFCVDSVCCDAACSGTCTACTTAKTGLADGTCGNVTTNSDPDNECTTECNGAGACEAPNGTACTLASQCQSAFCVDGVCCNAACTGQCTACNAAKTGLANGTCGNVATNSDPDNECTTECNGAGACEAANGTTCTLASQCQSAFCVDGVCCNSACNTPCYACSTAKKGGGSDGVCGYINQGTPPRNPATECITTAGSPCLNDGTCDGTGSCRKAIQGTPCGSGGICNSSTNTLDGQSCNGSGTCVTATGTPCTPGLCPVGGTQCSISCTLNSDCAIDAFCSAVDSKCTPKHNLGEYCGNNAAACLSGNCVDGVCCNTPCNGTCQVCAFSLQEPGTNGYCGNATNGTDPHNSCAAQAQSTCGFDGTCNGGGSCRLWAALTDCGPYQCVGNFSKKSICNGVGTCTIELGGQDCNQFKCDTNVGTCGTSCLSDTDCIGTAYCNQGFCTPDEDLGATCASGSQCKSGFCVDGICCDTACTGACRACSAQAKGSGVDGECGNVVDGADPHDDCTDSRIADSNSCLEDGFCSGGGTCRLYVADTSCATPTCADATTLVSKVCSGSGSCVQKIPVTDCGDYACITDPLTQQGACVETGKCTNNAECAPNAYCDLQSGGAGGNGGSGGAGGNGGSGGAGGSSAGSSGNCLPRLTIGKACTKIDECVSGFCIDGVCCETACEGTCKACSKAAGSTESDGNCGNVAEDTACASDPNNPCGFTGTCTTFGACEIQAYGQPCGQPICAGGLKYGGQLCNGLGACVPNPSTLESCFPYVCDVQDGVASSNCKTTCQEVDGDAGPSDCVEGFHCLRSICVPDTKTCASINDCTGTDVCDPVTKQCVPRPEPTPPDTSACNCEVPGKTSGSSGLPAIALALMAIGLRRRQRLASVRP